MTSDGFGLGLSVLLARLLSTRDVADVAEPSAWLGARSLCETAGLLGLV